MILATDIDFDRDGKQVSAVRVPYTHIERGATSLLVPIAVIRNGPGPTLLVTAGNHGDEYSGQVAAAGFVRSLEPEAIRGRVIVLPALNLPAATSGRRASATIPSRSPPSGALWTRPRPLPSRPQPSRLPPRERRRG